MRPKYFLSFFIQAIFFAFCLLSDGVWGRFSYHHLLGTKIVQGESRTVEKSKIFPSVMPSRRLFYEKIVQGESRKVEKSKIFPSVMPSRRLKDEKNI